ncbi:hypothetical protein P7C70_g6517, partial [Phenoliferia sp. Uapishka_3]
MPNRSDEEKRHVFIEQASIDLPSTLDPLEITYGSLARAARNVHRYANAQPQPAHLRAESNPVGWFLPRWTTSTMLASAEESRCKSIWYLILQASPLLSRLALRDTCRILRRMYEKVDFDELDLSRVVLNARYPDRIYVLDYFVTSRETKLNERHSVFRPTPVPRLREISKLGPERRKVVTVGDIFFELFNYEHFEKPPYVELSVHESAVTYGLGVVTPSSGKHLIENLSNDDQDYTIFSDKSLTPKQYVSMGRPPCHVERWVSGRCLNSPIFEAAVKVRNLEAIREYGEVPEEKGALRRIPVMGMKGYAEWEATSLEGEGMDDTFTIEDVSQMVVGRFLPPSNIITSWSDEYARPSNRWGTEAPIYLMLQGGFGSNRWLPMNAVKPDLDVIWDVKAKK